MQNFLEPFAHPVGLLTFSPKIWILEWQASNAELRFW
jgi:hypothetical protein